VLTPATSAAGKPPARPLTTGKQPSNTAAKPGTGGKQLDLSPQKFALIKRNTSAVNPGKPPSGKIPVAENTSSSRSTNSGSQSVRTGTGGKEPHRTENPHRSQTSSHLVSVHPGAKAQGALNQARPQTQRKQHHLISKTVKVFYVPEGYFTGVVKQQLKDSEFMIHWDDGSTTSAVLREEDETEDPENEDRWSILPKEDYEAQPARVSGQEKQGGNGANRSQKQITPPKQPPAPPPQQPTYEDDEEDNEENEPEDGNEDDPDT